MLGGVVARDYLGKWYYKGGCKSTTISLQTILTGRMYEKQDNERRKDNGERNSDPRNSAHGGVCRSKAAVMELSEIKINLDFENLIPKQTAEQFKQLEENMVSEGRARNPLVVWRGHDTLVDGHHRVRILKAHPELKWSVVEQDFTDDDEVREWIIKNALGTRNLTEADYTALMGTLYKMRKKKHGGNRGNQFTVVASAQNEHMAKEHSRISEQLAKELGVGRETVKRAEQFVDGLDAAEAVVPGFKDAVLTGEVKAQKQEVAAMRKQTPEEIKASVQTIKDRKGKRNTTSDRELANKIREITADARSVSTTGYGLAELIREVDALGDSFILSLSSMIKRRKNVMVSYDGGAEEIASRVDGIIEKLNELKKGFLK